MKWLVILLLLFSVMITPTITAGDPLPQELLLKTGLGVYNGVVPLVNMELKGEHVGLKGGFMQLPFELEGESGKASLYQLALKMYSPITYRQMEFYLGMGLFRPSFDVMGLAVEGGTWYQVFGGFERPLGERWSFGGNLRYLHSPITEMGLESRTVLGLGLSFNQLVTWIPRGPGDDSSHEGSFPGEDGPVPLSVSARGHLTGTSLPISLSGDWSIEADLTKGTGHLSISGSSSYGAFGYSGTGKASYTQGRLELVVSEVFYSDGLRVTGRAVFTVSSGGMRARVSGSRADGLAVQARIDGSTTYYQPVWE